MHPETAAPQSRSKSRRRRGLPWPGARSGVRSRLDNAQHAGPIPQRGSPAGVHRAASGETNMPRIPATGQASKTSQQTAGADSLDGRTAESTLPGWRPNLNLRQRHHHRLPEALTRSGRASLGKQPRPYPIWRIPPADREKTRTRGRSRHAEGGAVPQNCSSGAYPALTRRQDVTQVSKKHHARCSLIS